MTDHLDLAFVLNAAATRLLSWLSCNIFNLNFSGLLS